MPWRLQREIDVEVAGIEQLGEIVGDRQLLGLLKQERVLDRDGGGLDQHQQHVEVAAREVAPGAVEHLHDADDATARDERGAQHRPGLEAALLVEAGREALVFVNVVDDHRLAVLRHPTGHAFAERQPRARDLFPLGAQCRLEDELRAFLVDEQQRPRLGGDQDLDLAHHQLDHLLRLQDRVGRLDDVGEDPQLLRRGMGRVVEGVGGVGLRRSADASQDLAGVRVSRLPGADVEIEAQLRRAADEACVVASRNGPERLTRKGFSKRLDAGHSGARRDLEQRGVALEVREPGFLLPGCRGEEVHGEAFPGRALQHAPQCGLGENRDARQEPPSWTDTERLTSDEIPS